MILGTWVDGWTARWVKCWLDGRPQRQWLLGCTLQSSAVLRLSLGCPHFNTFIGALEEATQRALIPFAGGKCLRAGLLFLGGLEERINRNPAEFSKDKWQALPRGGRAPGEAGTAWLGSSSAENAAVGSELRMRVNVHQHLHCLLTDLCPWRV